MKVEYILDKEGGLDPTDPLGNLVLLDEDNNSLVLTDIFIDTWLLAFLDKLNKIDNNSSVKVDTFEEKYCVTVSNSNGELIFQYNGDEITTTKGSALLAFNQSIIKLEQELLKNK